MLLFTTLITMSLGVAFAQTSCGNQLPTNPFNPVIMRYTPYMSPQIGPTSTVWDTIITTWFNAIDCRYVTPLRVDENPAAQGPFTTYIRSPVLTITRVGCMPETTAVTRRDVRGENRFELRTIGAQQRQQLNKRRTAQEAVEDVAKQMPDAFPPDTGSLTVQAYRYLVSVNTAIFAINLVESGVDLNQTCTLLRDPVSQTKLFKTTIDPVQAGDIVCYAQNTGLYFSVPVSDIVTYLQDLIYAIQVRSSYPVDSQNFCWPLVTEDSPFLGIDTEGISNYLCPGNNTSSEPTITGATESTRSAGTGTIAGPPTGGPFANSTTSGGTSSFSGYGTNPSATVATSTPAPYGNSTFGSSITEATAGPVGTGGTGITYSTSSTVSNVTYNSGGTGTFLGTGNLQPVETSISPQSESVISHPTRQVRKW